MLCWKNDLMWTSLVVGEVTVIESPAVSSKGNHVRVFWINFYCKLLFIFLGNKTFTLLSMQEGGHDKWYKHSLVILIMHGLQMRNFSIPLVLVHHEEQQAGKIF